MPNIALRPPRVKALSPRGSAFNGRDAMLERPGLRVPASGTNAAVLKRGIAVGPCGNPHAASTPHALMWPEDAPLRGLVRGREKSAPLHPRPTLYTALDRERFGYAYSAFLIKTVPENQTGEDRTMGVPLARDGCWPTRNRSTPADRQLPAAA